LSAEGALLVLVNDEILLQMLKEIVFPALKPEMSRIHAPVLIKLRTNTMYRREQANRSD
jgi:hypothetical protein